jgi:alpha-ketoglutarate-dependent taurine dioxygenase
MRCMDSTVSVNGSYLKHADIDTIWRLVRSEGYAYIEGISDEFEHLTELSRLGTPIPHQGNDFVKDIKPDPRAAAETYSSSNMNKLNPHTEWYEASGVPPRFLALWCVREAQGEGGETAIADGYSFLKRFSAQDQRLLRERQYEWYGVSNLSGGPPNPTPYHPILERHPDGLIMRYSTQLLQRVKDDNLASRYITDGASFFEDECLSVSITRNSVLFWDNWRMMHARRAFSDPERHLRRVLLAA